MVPESNLEIASWARVTTYSNTMPGMFSPKEVEVIRSREMCHANSYRDNVEWDEEQERKALESVQKNSVVTLTDDEVKKFEDDANLFWDAFYGIHQNNFFKDRHWLFTEFPELKTSIADAGPNSSNRTNIFEIGCGVGNTIFPILKYNDDPNLRIFGCDFSSKAIDILRKYDEFDEKRCNVFVLDATAERWTDAVPFEENSIDIIVLIFVLSAIHPDK